MTHYLDNIDGGVTNEVENKISDVFFKVLSVLCQRLVITSDHKEFFAILHALSWQYKARDFDHLIK